MLECDDMYVQNLNSLKKACLLSLGFIQIYSRLQRCLLAMLHINTNVQVHNFYLYFNMFLTLLTVLALLINCVFEILLMYARTYMNKPVIYMYISLNRLLGILRVCCSSAVSVVLSVNC